MSAREAVVLGCRLSALTMEDAVAAIDGYIREKKTRQAVFLNAGKFAEMKKDPRVARAVNKADLRLADGQSVVWAGKFLGAPLPGRVAGIDLMERLLAAGPAKGHRFYFLGARQEVVRKMAEDCVRRYPGIAIAGYRNGYFTDHEEGEVAGLIAGSGADILFVGMSSPRKELFVERNLSRMNVPFVMGVGGSFDVMAGETRRAPAWMQNAGLEWCYRLWQEPGRMWRRYLFGNTAFILRVLAQKWRGDDGHDR